MIFEETIVSPLAHWENFYVIVGSSAGALTGLQFVVMALIAEGPSPATMQAVRAFGTPTVVHFCAALLISAVLSAPWDNLRNAGFVLGAFGVAGLAYAINVTDMLDASPVMLPTLKTGCGTPRFRSSRIWHWSAERC
ncbi:MAG: hypothetical protein M3O09_05480 [Acidobacteriota bacterium]|nr:hypothetical protein [Acidobacteriota bacterium]